MKKLLLTALLLFSCNLFAAGLTSEDLRSVGFNELSESQKAELIKSVTDKVQSNQSDVKLTKEITPDKIEQWSRIGTNIGQGLGAAAKELGIAVNDFATSPIGKLATILIVWHMIGGAIIHLIGGILIWIIGFWFLNFVVKKAEPPEITYSKERKNIFGNPAIESIKQSEMGPDLTIGVIMVGVIIIVLGMFTIFTF